jgi:hypothetical protein
MFGLSATLAPKLNGIQVGFPYVSKFIVDSNMKWLAAAQAPKAEAAAPAPAPASPAAQAKDAPKVEAKSSTDDALLN